MKKSVIASCMIALFLFSNTALAAFPDVTDETLYKTAIDWMADNGVIEGYPDGTFKPDQCVNRAEFLKMLFLTDENEWHMSEHYYPDVDAKDWFAEYVSYYTARGVVQGYPDGMFRPGQCVNRVEAIKMAVIEFDLLMDITELSTYDTDAGFTDIPGDAWYYQTCYSATDRNTVGLDHVNRDNPDGGFAKAYFYPGDSMSRKEVAEMLYRMKTVKDNNLTQYQDTYSPKSIVVSLDMTYSQQFGDLTFSINYPSKSVKIGELKEYFNNANAISFSEADDERNGVMGISFDGTWYIDGEIPEAEETIEIAGYEASKSSFSGSIYIVISTKTAIGEDILIHYNSSYDFVDDMINSITIN